MTGVYSALATEMERSVSQKRKLRSRLGMYGYLLDEKAGSTKQWGIVDSLGGNDVLYGEKWSRIPNLNHIQTQIPADLNVKVKNVTLTEQNIFVTKN